MRLLKTGDNYFILKDWDTDMIVEFTDKMNMRTDSDKTITAVKQQALPLFDFTSKWNLLKTVKDNTTKNNMLDLIITDCEKFMT